MRAPDGCRARRSRSKPIARAGALLLLMIALAGCANRSRVILLPDAAGKVGRVTVLQQQGSIALNQAYESAVTDTRGGFKLGVLDAGIVRRLYAAELAALPSKPETFQLHFMLDSIQLTSVSETEAPVFLEQIVKRPDAEVVLVGYSQTEGPVHENEQLSLMRALLIRSRLLAAGLSSQRVRIATPDKIQADPPASDEAHRPIQRRVEIRVR